MQALRHYQKDVVERLLAKNAEVHAEDNKGRNILHYAARSTFVRIAFFKMLFAKGERS
jgi:hypothetical protein